MLDDDFKKSATEKVTTMSANEYKEAFKAIGSLQTNEEWLCEYLVQFCRMSTNKKAKRIADLVANFIPRIEEINCNKFAWLRWLKEEHKDA